MCGLLFGNHDEARRSALSFVSDTQIGNLGLEEGSLRVGTTVLRMPLYHELRRHKSVPGLTEAAKHLAWERFARRIW